MAADLSTQIERLDAQGFSQVLEEIIAGESAFGYGHFRFDASEDLTDVTPTWALLSNTGAVYASGNCQDYQTSTDSFGISVRVSALVNAPSTLPPSSRDTSYQIRWSLNFPSRPSHHFVHGIRVAGLTQSPIGPSPTVELENDNLTVSLVTEKEYEVTVAVYGASNTKLFDGTVEEAVEVAGGYLYSCYIDPSSVILNASNPLTSSLDAYIAAWKAIDPNKTYSVNRYTSEIFIVNPSILAAIEDCRRMVMKARTTAFGFEDTLFDTVTLVSWLRRGRDLFNAAAGMLTEFTMTNATLGVREYWLRYSEVAMLLAQALAEGEKAFNYSGQAITLEVDKAQVYQGMADNLQQRLDNDIKPFKANLLKKGVTAGDGNINGIASGIGSTSLVGIGVHPSSSFGRRGFPFGQF